MIDQERNFRQLYIFYFSVSLIQLFFSIVKRQKNEIKVTFFFFFQYQLSIRTFCVFYIVDNKIIKRLSTWCRCLIFLYLNCDNNNNNNNNARGIKTQIEPATSDASHDDA